ncbi:MAG TPA: N-acetylmuramoyl-L-alanine amidase, partial [Methylomirabilota bacterium]|nr:N-acetylmuramoyl-L-alanine amidase [Methylomirabilota bacterium]
PVSPDEGGSYLAAERLAAVLKGTWSVKGPRGTLTVGSRSAQFTRNQARVLVAGDALTLDAPARTGTSGWLIPEDFLAKGLTRLAPGLTMKVVAVPASAPKATARPVAAAAPTIAFEDLRLRSYPSFTRIVLEMGAPVGYVIVDESAERKEIRMRLPGLRLAGPQLQEIDDGLVKELRLDPASGGAVLRIILEAPAGQVKEFALQDPARIVLDLYRTKEGAGPEGAPGGAAAQPLRLVVLDAGHGGHDPGATGPTGVQEKDVVLDVTRRVARMMEESGLGIKVVLSRTGDVFVPLRDRTNFANKQRADLFVSIHANAHPRSVSEGVETYFLSSEASDTESRQTAAIENGVVQLESPASQRKTDAIKSILWDLAQSEFQQESSFLAETVLDSMTRSLRLVNRGVKQAGFFVLGGAAMPAILIEIGFLTNPKEERKLATAEYREATARAIFTGLNEYKRRYDQRMRTALARPGGAAPR